MTNDGCLVSLSFFWLVRIGRSSAIVDIPLRYYVARARVFLGQGLLWECIFVGGITTLCDTHYYRRVSVRTNR